MNTMKPSLLLLLLLSPVVCLAIAPNSQFVSAVQLSVQDSTPELIQRSQVLVRQQFARNLEGIPAFRGTPFEVRTFGNELVFYLVTSNDVNVPMRGAINSLVHDLSDKVRMKGRSSVYLAKFAQSQQARGGYLETVVNDKHTQILAINAQAVPFRDLLKQLRTQLGSFNYMVPGECAERRVDLSFGQDQLPATPKTVEAVMSELATLFNLKLEKKNDTLIFTGECSQPSPQNRRGPSAELLTASFTPGGDSLSPLRPQQIVFPVLPLGQ